MTCWGEATKLSFGRHSLRSTLGCCPSSSFFVNRRVSNLTFHMMGNNVFSGCGPRPIPAGAEDDLHGDELEFAKERKAALRVVAQASFLCQKVQERLVSTETMEKKDQSPVTVADYASQAYIISELTKEFPEYPFIAEEDSTELKEKRELLDKVLEQVRSVKAHMSEEEVLAAIDKGNTASIGAETKLWWTLDPIDGTMGFLRKGQYAVALALMKDYKPILGVLGCPSLPLDTPLRPEGGEEGTMGCILVAVKGQGAFIRGLDSKEERRISVSDNADPTKSVFTESFVSSHSSHDAGADVTKKLGVVNQPIRIDSQCKYSIVARGDATAYVRISGGSYQEKIWDHAAGAIIVEEAGGSVCDLNGEPLDFSVGRTLAKNKGIVATNGKIHAAVLAAIDDVDPLNKRAK